MSAISIASIFAHPSPPNSVGGANTAGRSLNAAFRLNPRHLLSPQDCGPPSFSTTSSHPHAQGPASLRWTPYGNGPLCFFFINVSVVPLPRHSPFLAVSPANSRFRSVFQRQGRSLCTSFRVQLASGVCFSAVSRAGSLVFLSPPRADFRPAARLSFGELHRPPLPMRS